MSSTVPPRPEQRLTVHNEHHIERPDPYYWLNQKENPEVIAHLKAENAYCEAQLAHLADTRKSLYDEMLGRIQETDTSAPVQRDEYWYYTRTVEGLPYSIHCRKKGSLDADEEVYLDENVLAKDLEYFKLDTLSVSPNHRYVAWLSDVDGGERFTLTVKDLHTGETLPHQIRQLKWSLAWAADSATLFYCRSDAAQRPHKVFRWNIHTHPESEVQILHEPDERYFCHVTRTRDHKWVLIGCSSKQTSEYRAIDAHQPDSAAQVVRTRKAEVEYGVSHRDGHFYLRINEDAENFKVVRRPTSDASAPEVEVVSHQEAVYITSVNVFTHHIVLSERFEGLPRLRVIDAEKDEAHIIAMPEEVYEVGAASNPMFDTDHFRYSYTSPTTPRSVYSYNMNSREQSLLKQQPVRGGYDSTDYESHRIWVTAEDGAKVPMTVFHRKGISLDGSNPTYLRGYGSYGASYPVTFSSHLISLLQRGVVVAIGHIRGGSEMGRHWYENGKFFHKKKTFSDFIACAETLISKGYARPETLAISGGSAGGLLIGAVINARPDLFRAALAMVPFVDVATTMSDPSLPLTVVEYEEWGDPNKKDVFEYILSYSPYDQVKEQAYPALFVTAGLNDPRVSYWEPAKWVARLRDRRTNDASLVFRIHMGAGHGGASGRYGYLEDISWQYGFLLGQFGLA